MTTIKMALPSQVAFGLAKELASEVLHEVHCRHNNIARRLRGETPVHQNKTGIAEVRAVVSSIEDRYMRLWFCGWLKFCLEEMRKERGESPRWQDYEAKVRQHMQEAA